MVIRARFASDSARGFGAAVEAREAVAAEGVGWMELRWMFWVAVVGFEIEGACLTVVLMRSEAWRTMEGREEAIEGAVVVDLLW